MEWVIKIWETRRKFRNIGDVSENYYIFEISLAQGQRSLTCQYMLNLYKIGSTTVPVARYQVSRQLAQWFWRRRFFKVFAIIWAWWPSWSCEWTEYINFVSRFA